MNNKMVSVLYGFSLVMMLAVAYLVAADVFLPGNVILVAVLIAASVVPIVADAVCLLLSKRSHREIAAA